MGRFTNIFRRKPIEYQRREGAAVTPMTLEDWQQSVASTPMKVATVYSCVKLLCDSVAQLPLRYLRSKDGIYQPVENELTALLNIEPDFSCSAYDSKSRLVMDVLVHGNAYYVPVREGARVERLVLVPPQRVQHNTTTDTYKVSDPEQGIYGTYQEWEIIHIKGLGEDPKTGMGVLEYARATTEIARAGDKETAKRIRSGGSIRGIVSNFTGAKGFGKNQDNQLRGASLDINGRFNAGEQIVSIPGSIDFKQLAMTSADLQFLETRKFTVLDICRFFRVPPAFVFSDTATNYKSAEMANVSFLSLTLNPWLCKIENELTRKLVPRTLWGRYKFQFDRSSLYACDLDSKGKYQAQMIANGQVTINELRKLENRPPIEGGDIILVSANLKSINETTTGLQP